MRDALPELGDQRPDRREHRRGGDRDSGAAGDRGRGERGGAARAGGATPGEVLIGEATLRARRATRSSRRGGGAAGAEGEVRAGAGVPARLGAGRAGAQPRVAVRRPRARSSRRSRTAWERAQAQARCELVTVVGDAGRRASRGSWRRRSPRSRLASCAGRCLPYGEGITYWPVVEVVKQLAALPSDPVAAAAIRSLLGESDVGTSGDEIAWAFRKLLEEQAPLVVVFDDIQWGERDVPRSRRVDARCSRRARRSCSCAWPGRSWSSGVPAGPGRCGSSRCPPTTGGRADRRRSRRASCASGSRTPRAATRCSSRRCSRWPPRTRRSRCRRR